MTLKIQPCLVAGITALLLAPAQAAEDRWFSPEQAAAAEAVYRQNCIACHLENGAGTDNWQARDADGKLPPPLNGTAHTWHHDLGVLARTTVEGSAKLGGSMPAFGNELSAEEIEVVIAYVQSLWPSEVSQIQKAGISVRYLSFPRSGKRRTGYKQLRSVWCAEDRQWAMTSAKTEANYEIGDTGRADADAVDAGYRLGVEVGLSGTPTVVLPDGSMIPGYRPWEQLAEALGVKTP